MRRRTWVLGAVCVVCAVVFGARAQADANGGGTKTEKGAVSQAQGGAGSAEEKENSKSDNKKSFETYTVPLSLPAGATELVLKKIPAGTFAMGSPDSDSNAYSDEKPQHSVTISQDFYMGVYEVTQAQYEAVTGSDPSYFSGNNRPVETVSWYDAQDFIEALNTGGYAPEGYEFVLPTEAQWEYCCRAGTTTKYSFGDDSSDLGTYAWYGGNSGSPTHDVGSHSANPWGLYDMHGNVWEWCRDWYDSDYYSSSPSIDPDNTKTGKARVVRGGCWNFSAEFCRSAHRHYYYPDITYGSHGFRLALDLK